MTIAASGPFGSVPADCGARILSYLPLVDVLRFAELSVSTMKETLLNLYQRRENMRTEYVFITPDLKLMPYTPTLADKLQKCSKIVQFMYLVLPSAVEQAIDLKKHLPCGYTGTALLREYIDDMNMDIEFADRTKSLLSFSSIFDLYKTVLRANKSFVKLMHIAFFTNTHNSDTRILLSQYVGDVMCFAHFANYIYCGIVEGCPATFPTLYNEALGLINISHYQYWIYCHSLIIQDISFQPFRDHFGLNKLPTNLLIPMGVPCPNFEQVTMTLVYSEFGPLGASFRQRDTKVMHTVTASEFICIVDVRAQPRGEPQLSLRWMYNVHEQARNNQPMTVQPPVVIMSISTDHNS